MFFSDRMGITPPKNFLKYDEIDEALSNRMWNLIEENINNICINSRMEEFQRSIIDKFFKHTMLQYERRINRYGNVNILKFDENIKVKYLQLYIHDKYEIMEWNKKYDLMEFLIKIFLEYRMYEKLVKKEIFAPKLEIFVTKLNNILEEEKTAYRVIDYKITPIIHELELESVSNASINNGSKFKIATSHIKSAIDALSKKPEGDYNKVITSSVLALEVALKESLDITGNDKISNKELIGKFQKKYKVNKFITEPINQFIGILRNSEYDTLHSSPDNKNSSKETPFKATFMEAKYVLVMSCNFLNYVKSLNT